MRDHRDEHEGCKVMWPWLKWCKKYRYASQLVGYALEDVKTMPEEDFRTHYTLCKMYHDVSRYRSSARSAYIAHRERSHEDDVEFEKESAQRFVDMMAGGPGATRTAEAEFEDMWKRRQQTKAVGVLYAYGMLDKRTGEIKLDNLKKLK